MRRCFVDMDGVLVDFVGGACRLHGVPNPYDNKDNWGKYGIENMVGVPNDKFYGSMDYSFWANLDPSPECFDIIRLVEHTFGRDNTCILTKPVMTYGCSDGKMEWLKKHLNNYWKTRQYLIGSPKQFCAHPYSWLIDDSTENVETFARWGGNIIQVPRPWNRRHSLSDNIMLSLINDLPQREIHLASV